MIVENGKIIEATKRELYQRWLSDDWAEFMPFEEFLYHMKQAGVTIIEEGTNEQADRVPATVVP